MTPRPALQTTTITRWLWISLGSTIVIMLALSVLDAALRTEVAPQGIVSFELAGDYATAQTILASWSPRDQLQAALSLGLDYLFMPAYAAMFSLACLRLGRALEARGLTVVWASRIAVAQWGAASLDGLENFALIRILLGDSWSSWPAIAWTCAVLKFAILFLAISYLSAGALSLLRSTRKNPTT